VTHRQRQHRNNTRDDSSHRPSVTDLSRSMDGNESQWCVASQTWQGKFVISLMSLRLGRGPTSFIAFTAFSYAARCSLLDLVYDPLFCAIQLPRCDSREVEEATASLLEHEPVRPREIGHHHFQNFTGRLSSNEICLPQPRLSGGLSSDEVCCSPPCSSGRLSSIEVCCSPPYLPIMHLQSR
jgi:hypothetical protein